MITSHLLYFIVLPILFIGLLGWLFEKVSKNPMAQTLFERETLKAMDSKDGKNHIREQAQLATKDTFDRAFSKIEKLETTQECHSVDINKLNNSITRIDVNMEYIKKYIESQQNKKTSK